VIVSRLNVVQAYAGSDIARLDQLLGILSPRRDQYQMEIPADRFLRVMPGMSQNNFLQQNISQSTSEIVQRERFFAEQVGIDGGIFANFSMIGFTQPPALGGSVSLSYSADDGSLVVRGLVRNDGDFALQDAVVLLRNRFFRLTDPLEPGELLNFQTSELLPVRENPDTLNPLSSRLETVYGIDLGNENRNSFAVHNSLESVRVLMGDTLSLYPARGEMDSDPDEEENRRRALLRSFMRDQYAAQGIASSAYLIGWSNEALPQDIQIAGISYRAVDTSLYIVELDTSTEPAPASTTVTLLPNQFSWSVREREQAEGGVEDVTLINPGWVAVRYTPIASAILASVSELTIQLDRSSSYGRDVTVAVWNWQTQEWDAFDNTSLERYVISDPAAYLGPRNEVDVRLSLERLIGGSSASARIRGIRITQTGRY
jgi:hypothetical protein